MHQRLQIALAQIEAGKTLLNDIRQIIYSLYRAKKKNAKNVYNKIMNSIKVKV